MKPFHLPDQIGGFSRVEYLSIFIALLYAFSVAEFFLGWGKMLRHRAYLVFSRPHLLWSFIFFWGSILNWYILWPRLLFIDKGFAYFILILLPILLFFFSTIFLFPDFDKVQDMKVYYAKNHPTIVLLFSVTLLTNVLIGIFMKESEWQEPLNLLRLFMSLLGISAVALRLERIQSLLVYAFLISILAGTWMIVASGI